MQDTANLTTRQLVLVIDDTPENLSLMRDLLDPHYVVKVAPSGERGLEIAAATKPDLILLDVMMPDMDGYEVCRRLKATPDCVDIPVIFVTAMTETENEEEGLALGAVDYLTKPISPPIVLARVRSQLALKAAADMLRAKNTLLATSNARVKEQKAELAEWNLTLEARVADGIAEVERLSRMKRFFSPRVAEMITAGDAGDPMQSHRAEITVVFIDLRGYTAFTEVAEPEDVMTVLREYHADMGRLITKYNGTVERFAGDAIMIFFNDPVPLPNPAEAAVRLAMEMHAAFTQRVTQWQKRGFDLQMGIGIAQGYATVGIIGFEGRLDYGAIGAVSNLSARLCGEAKAGQTLVQQRVLNGVEEMVEWEPVGHLALKGIPRPVAAFNVLRLQG